MVSYDIDDMRVQDFIASLHRHDDDLDDLRKYAIDNDVPIIRDETRDFLNFVLKIERPRKILELGTAIAYSTLVIYKALDGDLDKIVTVENYEPRIIDAKKNIDKFFDKGKVELIEKDITEYLDNIDEKDTYDFIFLDAAKAQYIAWLPKLKKLMRKGSVLLADNIFKDGEVLESRYAIIKRDRTIHKRMREFLHEITSDTELDTTILNIGDGISVSIKK